MKNNKIKDERVIQLNNTIQSEAYLLVLFLAAISIFTKTYMLHMDFTWVLTELVIIVLSIIYIVMRATLLGHDFVNNSKRAKTLTVLAIIALSLTIGISNGIKNYSLYSNIYRNI